MKDVLQEGYLSTGKRWRLLPGNTTCLRLIDNPGKDKKTTEFGDHLILTLDDDVKDCSREEKGELYVMAEDLAEAYSRGKVANRYFIRKNGTGLVRLHTVHFHIVLPHENLKPNSVLENPEYEVMRGVDPIVKKIS